VLSFLSKHSTRDPGVCLDEIAIALGAKGGNIQTILVESEREVKPPPSISHIQWLDMHDWKERRATGETAWEQWYQAKLAEIVAVVESDESRRFAGEIKTLEDLLKPTVSDFAADARIRQLLEKKLVGRTWLFEAVEKWRTTAERDARLFWLMGAPGIGKSAFAAHLAHEYGRGTVIAVQFCDWKKPDHRDAGRIIRTLAFQIATRLPDYRKLLLTLPILTELDRKNSAELFDGLLTKPLKLSITGGRERYLIVIDALDEAGSASAQGGDGRNELVEVLARYAGQLPDWIGLVVTSRPEFDVTTPFQALKPFPFETKSAANSDDIRAYLRRELAAQLQNRPDADRLVEQILEKSEGVFLYVEGFCDDVRKGYYSLDHPEKFPQGLGEKFFMDFQRYFPDLEKFRKDARPALRAILAAREPLPTAIIRQSAGWPEWIFQKLESPRAWKLDELQDFMNALGSLFPVVNDFGENAVKPYHKALADWVTDSGKAGAYFVSADDGHELLAWSCWNQFQMDVAKMSVYFLRYGVQHLRAAGRPEDVRIIWENEPFRRRRIEMGILNLFLCAAWRGDSEFTSKLRNDLITQRFIVWPNREDDIHTDASFAQQTLEMIKESDSLILVLSPQTIASNYARNEWRFALKTDKTIFPILRVPDWSLIPDEIKLIQCADFRNDTEYKDRFAKMVERLRQPEPELGALFGVPSLPPHFTPRPEAVRRVMDELLADLEKPVVVSNCIGLFGMGGIGKSVLAAIVARNREVRRAFSDGIIWISVGERQGDISISQLIASNLGIKEQFRNEIERQARLRHFLVNKDILLVLDDIRQIADTDILSILGSGSRALLTTRNVSVLETIRARTLTPSKFSEGEALHLLSEIIGVAPENLPSEAFVIVEELASFPLALALCGAYVKRYGCTWSEYLARYRHAIGELRIGTGKGPASLQSALRKSLEGLSVLEQRRLAELCLALHDGVISGDAVHSLWSGTGNLSAEACHALLIKFQGFALIRIQGQGQECRITVHQLVSDLLRHFNLVQ
jgi:hypothetical protein